METHTKNAYKILEQQLENTFILPLDYKKEEYTIYITNNIDYKEETLSSNKISFYICIQFTVFNNPSVFPTYNFWAAKKDADALPQ